jgi:hypothetical protein
MHREEGKSLSVTEPTRVYNLTQESQRDRNAEAALEAFDAASEAWVGPRRERGYPVP